MAIDPINNGESGFSVRTKLNEAIAEVNDLGSAAFASTSDFDPAGSASAAQAFARQRSNHTGTQPVSTIAGLGAAATRGVVGGPGGLTTAQGALDYVSSQLQIFVPDPLRRSVESASGGKCTVEYTANNQPCFMHVIPRLRWEDLLPGQQLGTGTHEAFIANGVEKSELLVGMYQAAALNGELVSQPGLAPRRSINFDNAVSEAQAAGFNMFGNWEWSAIALWCMANGFQPRGNTNFGRSHSHPHEQGVNVEHDNTATGSGPNSWSHNNAANGIADLVGNVWEWVRGFKMLNGRILLAPDNDHTLSEGAFVDTGWDMPTSGTFASQDGTTAPEAVKRALIMPNGISDPGGSLWTNLEGERLPFRGGSRTYAANAGLGALNLRGARTNSDTRLGLRLSRLV